MKKQIAERSSVLPIMFLAGERCPEAYNWIMRIILQNLRFALRVLMRNRPSS